MQIGEQSAAIPRPYQLSAKFATREAAAVPIEPGELQFRVSVNIVFQLSDIPGKPAVND